MADKNMKKKKFNLVHYMMGVVWSTLQMHCLKFAVQVAILPGIAAAVICLLDDSKDFLKDMLPEKSVYNGLCTLIIMCVVFHTAQSYSRFMSGLTLVYEMLGEFHDVAALLVTFSMHSKGSLQKKQAFLDTLARLCSMLFALCIADLEDFGGDEEDKKAFTYDLLDPEGLDEHTLDMIEVASDKPICVYQRLLDLMTEAFGSEIMDIPAPLYTRCFQELGNGMIKYHECLKFRDAPFPFPFMIITDTLLVVYTIYTPFMFASLAAGPIGAAIFTFILVCCIWLLHCVAEELENPFGHDVGDLKAEKLIRELNHKLLALLENANGPAPHPAESAVRNLSIAHSDEKFLARCTQSFSNVISKVRSSRSSIGFQFETEQNRENQSGPSSSYSPPEEVFGSKLFDGRSSVCKYQLDVFTQPFQEGGIQDNSELSQTDLLWVSGVGAPPMQNVSTLPMQIVAWKKPRTPRTPVESQQQIPVTSPTEECDRDALEFSRHAPGSINLLCTPHGKSRTVSSDANLEACSLQSVV